MTIPKRKLGELGEFRNGLNYSKENFGTGLKVISVKDFGDRWRPDLTILDEISPAGMRIANSNLQRGDIVFVRSNGNKELIGRSMLIEDDLEDVSFSGFCIRFRPSDPNTNSRFLSLFFRTSLFRRVLSQQGKGTNINNLNQSILERMEVPYPQPIVQDKITEVASAYDDLIETNRRRIALLEEAARLLYREWFVHFRFPGHESVPLVDSPLGPIPDGWEVKKLGQLADQMRRSVPKGKLEDPTPYVGLEHIPRQSLALNDWEVVEELGSNKLTFEAGEVLFGKIRPYFHKVSIAPFDGICSADTIVIRSKKPEWRALVISCVFSEAFVAHASATANGAKMPRADWKVLKDYLLVLPTSELLAKFGAVFEDVDHQTRNLIRRNQTLRQTRDLLLPKLLSQEASTHV